MQQNMEGTLISQSKRNDSLVFVSLGDDYYKSRFYLKSSQMYEAAIKLNPQQNYQTYTNYGFSLYMEAKYEEAIQIYDIAINMEPHNPQGYINKGDSLKKLQRYSEAIQMYDLAIQLDPENWQGYLNKANTLLLQKNTMGAQNVYEQVIRNNSDLKIYQNIGNEFYEQKQYEEALYIFDMIIKIDPNYHLSYFIKGDILMAQCKSDEAIQIYDQVARIQADTNEFQIRGEKFNKQRKYKEAIQMYDILIKYHPELTESYLKKGDIFFMQGQIEDANEIYTKHAGPFKFTNLFMQNTKKEGQYNEAVQFYQARIQHQQGQIKFYEQDILFQKGDILIAQGRIQEGIQMYREAQNQNRNQFCYFQRVEKYYSQKQYDVAIQLCDISIEYNPKEYLAYLKKGDILVHLERMEEAQALYQQASQICGDINFFNERGDEFFKMQKYELAIILYDIVIKINPLNYRGYLLKGHSLIALGRFKECLDMYDKSVPYLMKVKAKVSSYLDDIKHLVKRGEQFYKQQRYEEAIHVCDLILMLNKKFDFNQNVYLIKGDCLNDLNRFQEALEMYGNAIQLNVHESTLYERGINLFTQQKFEQAIKVLDMFIQLFEKSHQSNSQQVPADWGYLQRGLLVKGDSLLQLGRIDEAMKIYYSTKLESHDKIGYYNRGIILLNRQKYEEAIQLFNKIHNFDPYRYKSLIQKGHSLLWLGRIKEGIEMYDAAIQLNKNKMECLKRAEYYHIRNKYKEAIKLYDMALKLDPQCCQSYISKGDALLAIGKEKSAMECFKLALDHNPNIEEYFKRGDYFYKNKNYKIAIFLYDFMIQIDPNSHLGYLKKGDSLKAFGQDQMANQSYKMVIELHPNILNYIYEGDQFLKQKCYQNAIKLYDLVINLIPNYYLGYFLKGYALFVTESYQEAIMELDTSIKLNPQNNDAYFYKGQALQHLERYEDAIQAYNLAKYLIKEDTKLFIDYKGYNGNKIRIDTEKIEKLLVFLADQRIKCQSFLSSQRFKNNIILVWLLNEQGKYQEAFQAMKEFNQNIEPLPNQRYQELISYK